MICPVCKSEFPGGTKRCLDCNVALVKALPEDESGAGTKKRDVVYKPVLDLQRDVDITLVKRILISGGIQHYFKGEYLNAIEPEEFPATLMVQEDRVEEVKRLLEKKNLIDHLSGG